MILFATGDRVIAMEILGTVECVGPGGFGVRWDNSPKTIWVYDRGQAGIVLAARTYTAREAEV